MERKGGSGKQRLMEIVVHEQNTASGREWYDKGLSREHLGMAVFQY